MKLFFLNIIGIVVCCVACLPGISSETASVINIQFPANLPDSLKNGGYSICLERVDTSDSLCTKSFLNHKRISDASADLDVESDCAKGYRMKMWLWVDSGTHKPLYAINPKKSKSTYTYRDGYVIIDHSKLQESNLSLGLHFSKVTDSSSGSASSSEWADAVTDIIRGATGSSSSGSSYSGSVSGNTSCNHENNIKDEVTGTSDAGAAGGSGSSSGSDSAPTGSIISLGDKAPSIKASSYPSMVMYTFATGCSPCEQLKSWVQSNLSSFKGKIHVYQNDVPFGDTTAGGAKNCSGDTPRPVVEFYDKNGNVQTSDCVVGFDESRISSAIQRLKN